MKKLPALKEKFVNEIVPLLMKKFNYKNIHQVPRLEKIILNMGLGEAIQNQDLLKASQEDLSMIAGQKPVITRAKKSISAFKLRKGMLIGCMVTLRGNRMYEFLHRFINIALPRVRDFRGISPKGFDGRGNYTLGLREQIIFPEVNYDKVLKIKGMNVSIVTTAKTDEEGFSLLSYFGMPFAKKQ